MPVNQRKSEYFERMEQFMDSFSKIFIVHADNVGSHQMQQIRQSLRGDGEVLMGKNTMMRKCIQLYLRKHPGHPYEQLLARLRGNVGLVFTDKDLGKIRDVIEANRVPAPAKAGSIAPSNVIVPAGPTGCDPGQTGFFQALNIATKITRGQIEIISDVPLLGAGERVLPSHAVLLAKLNIKPFTYGLVIKAVYDNGSLFDAAVLKLTPDDIAAKFLDGVRTVAAISLSVGMPTLASVPHSLAAALKKLIAICTSDDVDYSFKEAESALKFLADPSAFAAAAAPAAGGAAAAAKEEVKEEEEEEDAGAVGGLFGGGGGGDDY